MENGSSGGHRLLSLSQHSLSRREVLRGAVGFGLAIPAVSTLLAACGEDDGDEDETEDGTADDEEDDEVADEGDAEDEEETPEEEEPEDDEEDDDETSDDERRGGTFQGYETVGPESLDPYISGGQPQSLWSAYTYSQLFMLSTGPDVPRGSQEAVPDAAESAEISDDAIVYTITLRDNVRFHPPLDRNMVADDVVATWERGQEMASDRLVGRGVGEIVETIEAPDDATVVFTLNEPYPFFQQLLADPKQFFIMPQEMGDEYNPDEEAIGSGPWVLDEFQPDSVGRFSRFEDWHHGPEIPYYDEAIVNIVPEYSTQLNQFLGGNLDFVILQSSDLARVQEEIPDVQIYERAPYPLSILNFSPREERWEDDRLRRAVSMAIDRDALLDAAYGLSELEEQGIEVERTWHNFIPVAFSEFWLDPKGDQIDPEVAANFQYDPEQAAALIEEAGGGFDTELHFAAAGSRYGEPYQIMSELMIGYWREVGLNVQAVEEDYNTEFLGSENTSGGNFDGMMWIAQTRVDPYQYLGTQITTNPDEAMYERWSDDEDLLALRDEIRAMTDPDELREAFVNIQNEQGRRMYQVPMMWSSVVTYVAYQPWVENALDYQSFTQNYSTEALPNWWSSR